MKTSRRQVLFRACREHKAVSRLEMHHTSGDTFLHGGAAQVRVQAMKPGAVQLEFELAGSRGRV